MSEYFHPRSGVERPVLTSARLRELTANLFRTLWDRGYLEEALGKDCVDGHEPGEHGDSLAAHLLTVGLIDVPDPVWLHLDRLTDPEVLGVHELVHDLVSEPLRKGAVEHTYNRCGLHHTNFDGPSGKRYFRERANKYLHLFEVGYRLREDGRIELELSEPAAGILESPLPLSAPEAARRRVDNAVKVYRGGRTSWDERRMAVRELADVLEFLRKDAMGKLAKQDEKDLFNILNNFSIRHLRDTQRLDYDETIFLTWIFYELLAAIHACLHLTAR